MSTLICLAGPETAAAADAAVSFEKGMYPLVEASFMDGEAELFHKLRQDLRDHYAAKSPYVECLVEDILAARWQIRRLQEMEGRWYNLSLKPGEGEEKRLLQATREIVKIHRAIASRERRIQQAAREIEKLQPKMVADGKKVGARATSGAGPVGVTEPISQQLPITPEPASTGHLSRRQRKKLIPKRGIRR